MKSLIIFDLDGTLLDTIGDMAASANYALEKCGYPTHEITAYRFFIGNGINKLFERILPEGEKSEENILKIRQYFLSYYHAHSAEQTAPYPGIKELLQKLQDAGIKLAVASNKYQDGTVKLVNEFFPKINFSAIFGQRENIAVKPDPTIVYDILAITKTEKEKVLYVGDSGVDMQTANNSGIQAAGVTWGFRPRTELEEFSPAYLVDHAEEIYTIALEN